MNHTTATYQPPDSPHQLVLAWIRRARESQFSHYGQATKFRRASLWLGVPVIVLTTIVGTAVFTSIAHGSQSPEVKLSLGLLSVLAAVLSSLQTFMKLPEKAELHRKFGAKYGSIRRRLEQVYSDREGQQITHQVLELLNRELSAIAEEAPDVPDKALKNVQKSIRDLQGNG